MRFIQTGNNDKNGSKTFINFDMVILIDKHKDHYKLWEGFSGCSSSHCVYKHEIGYEKIKKMLGDL